MRLLYFAPRTCWPPNTGAMLRNYHLARSLARHARVTYLAFADDDEATPAARQTSSSGGRDASPVAVKSKAASEVTANAGKLREDDPAQWCEQVVIVPRERGYTLTKLARGAIGRMPVTVLNYTSRVMAAELARLCDAQAFDAVQIESIHLAAYLPLILSARNRPLAVCDWHNIESDLMLQYSERAATNPLRRAYARRTARQLRALERRIAEAVDANIMVSEPDRARLLTLAPTARAFVIENGVDTGYFSDEQIEAAHRLWRRSRASAATPRAENHAQASAAQPMLSSAQSRQRILFVGSMDYHANVDGATHFARYIWPRVLEQTPGATLTIVGRNPTPEVRALAELPGVEVTGTVDDVRPFYREALASVIPLRVGGGSRLKILEAMAAGVPVISTRLGAEGIQAIDGESIIFAETADEYCRAIAELAGDSRRWQEIAAAGRALASARYDWSSLGASLRAIYESLLAERRAES